MASRSACERCPKSYETRRYFDLERSSLIVYKYLHQSRAWSVFLYCAILKPTPTWHLASSDLICFHIQIGVKWNNLLVLWFMIFFRLRALRGFLFSTILDKLDSKLWQRRERHEDIVLCPRGINNRVWFSRSRADRPKNTRRHIINNQLSFAFFSSLSAQTGSVSRLQCGIRFLSQSSRFLAHRW